MEGPCYGNGEDYNRKQFEAHEREMWGWVEKYESGEAPDLDKAREFLLRPRHPEWAGPADSYIPPEVGAIIMFQTGAHKKTIFEILTS